jgi:hypothetical protein
MLEGGCDRSIGECNCDCHKVEDMVHCMACCSRCLRCGKNVAIGMEEFHDRECESMYDKECKHTEKILTAMKETEKQLTPEEQAVVDDAKDLMEKVLVRIEKSTRKYGANYVLANVMKETEEEWLDIIGWPLLEAVRMRQLSMKKLAELNGRYLDKFLEFQTDDYLSFLKQKIEEELTNR